MISMKMLLIRILVFLSNAFRGMSAGTIRNANDLPKNSVIRISSVSDAANWSNLPLQNICHIITFGFETNRKAQIFISGTTTLYVYVRSQRTGTWGDWREVTTQETTTTWQSVTKADSAYSDITGGYFREGKHVYVHLRFRGKSLTANTAYDVFTGFPSPAVTNPCFSCMAGSTMNGIAFLNGGTLRYKPSAAVSTTNYIIVEGHYVAA